MGLPLEAVHVISVITELTKIPCENICIVLLKLSKNYTFSDLRDGFNMNEKKIRGIFSSTLPLITNLFEQFIVWLSPNIIETMLPIAFRLHYRNIVAIIDCFEIEIQKPLDPVLQALTWSKYKKCNTLKFLIAYTPNRMTIFVSSGYGGRTSDLQITEMSGFLDKLPQGSWVMADLGFKGLDARLQQQGCKLVRSPSAQSGEKMSKADVRRMKQIASLRIHVERVIGRLHHFALLAPHSCVQHTLIKYLDHCMRIACDITICILL